MEFAFHNSRILIHAHAPLILLVQIAKLGIESLLILLIFSKKIIKFAEENNEIIERKLLYLKLHPKKKQYYFIHAIYPNHILLENRDNHTDVLLLAEMNN